MAALMSSFGVPAEVVFVEVLKFDGLLDEVLLKLLLHGDVNEVGGYQEVLATVHGDVDEVWTSMMFVAFGGGLHEDDCQ